MFGHKVEPKSVPFIALVFVGIYIKQRRRAAQQGAPKKKE